MTIKTVTHINFRAQAREALTFYLSVFGGEIAIVTHAQAYGTTDAAEADLVSWGQVVSEAGFAVMAFDVPASQPREAGVAPYFISVRGDNREEVEAYWARLSEGATIIRPLAESAWAKRYGMLKDRFGVTWVLDVPA